jgi:hypothetical protein
MVDARVNEGEQGWRFMSGTHRMLLRLAGRIPDDDMTGLRLALARGDLWAVPDTVSGGAAVHGLTLPVGDVALLREVMLAYADREPQGIAEVPIAEAVPATGHRFFPVPGEVLAANATRIPPRLDLTGGASDDPWDLPPQLAALEDIAMDLTDAVDATPLGWLPKNEDVRSIARAYRFDPTGPLMNGVRVVLVTVADFSPAWDVAGRVINGLHSYRAGAGAQVEVLWEGDERTPYHAAAEAGSALLWRSGAV